MSHDASRAADSPDRQYGPHAPGPDELNDIAEREIGPSDEALDNPLRDGEPGPRSRSGQHYGAMDRAPTQLEMRFASEVSGASWADQRAHNEAIDGLVKRLRREGL